MPNPVLCDTPSAELPAVNHIFVFTLSAKGGLEQ
jgi:hypothetical protein